MEFQVLLWNGKKDCEVNAMALFVFMFLAPLIMAIGLMVYWFVVSIKDREFMDAAFSLVVILSVVGAIGMFLG